MNKTMRITVEDVKLFDEYYNLVFGDEREDARGDGFDVRRAGKRKYLVVVKGSPLWKMFEKYLPKEAYKVHVYTSYVHPHGLVIHAYPEGYDVTAHIASLIPPTDFAGLYKYYLDYVYMFNEVYRDRELLALSTKELKAKYPDRKFGSVEVNKIKSTFRLCANRGNEPRHKETIQKFMRFPGSLMSYVKKDGIWGIKVSGSAVPDLFFSGWDRVFPYDVLYVVVFTESNKVKVCYSSEPLISYAPEVMMKKKDIQKQLRRIAQRL